MCHRVVSAPQRKQQGRKIFLRLWRRRGKWGWNCAKEKVAVEVVGLVVREGEREGAQEGKRGAHGEGEKWVWGAECESTGRSESKSGRGARRELLSSALEHVLLFGYWVQTVKGSEILEGLSILSNLQEGLIEEQEFFVQMDSLLNSRPKRRKW